MTTASSGIWFHGSPEKFDTFSTVTEHTFGTGASESPLFYSRDKAFARRYAGYQGVIYSVRLRVRKTFDGADLFEPSRYWPPPRESMTSLGQKLYDDLANNRIFKNTINSDDDYYSVFGDSQGLLASILKMDYDTIETTEMKAWLKKQGFDSAYVTGDGPKNIGVFSPSLVELVEVEPAHPVRAALLDAVTTLGEARHELEMMDTGTTHPEE